MHSSTKRKEVKANTSPHWDATNTDSGLEFTADEKSVFSSSTFAVSSSSSSLQEKVLIYAQPDANGVSYYRVKYEVTTDLYRRLHVAKK
jgi:hypothetical protein